MKYLLLFIAFLGIGTGVSNAQIYDDTYYMYVEDEYVNSEEEEEVNNSTSYYQYDESSRYEDDEDFYYSSQIQRFNRPYNNFNYYSNVYVDPFFNMGWYNPSSFYWYPSNPYYTRPGFYFTIGNSWGGFGNGFAYNAGWGNPWLGNGFYGNSFYGNNFYWNNFNYGYGGYPGWNNGCVGNGYYNNDGYNRRYNRQVTSRRGNGSYDMGDREVNGRTQNRGTRSVSSGRTAINGGDVQPINSYPNSRGVSNDVNRTRREVSSATQRTRVDNYNKPVTNKSRDVRNTTRYYNEKPTTNRTNTSVRTRSNSQNVKSTNRSTRTTTTPRVERSTRSTKSNYSKPSSSSSKSYSSPSRSSSSSRSYSAPSRSSSSSRMSSPSPRGGGRR